ncbi:MAG: DoxX family protein [Fimbriimonadaceae bacterium]
MASSSKTTPNDIGLLIIRFVVGTVFLYYGSQKLLGVFGGAGFQGTLDGFQRGLGIPPVLGSLAIIAEFFGGLGLIVGLLTRVAAFGLAVTMGVAVSTKVAALNLYDRSTFSEFAFPLVLGTVCLALLVQGAGTLSLDGRLFSRKRK